MNAFAQSLKYACREINVCGGLEYTKRQKLHDNQLNDAIICAAFGYSWFDIALWIGKQGVEIHHLTLRNAAISKAGYPTKMKRATRVPKKIVDECVVYYLVKKMHSERADLMRMRRYIMGKCGVDHKNPDDLVRREMVRRGKYKALGGYEP